MEDGTEATFFFMNGEFITFRLQYTSGIYVIVIFIRAYRASIFLFHSQMFINLLL